jgi:hypothetical protein
MENNQESITEQIFQMMLDGKNIQVILDEMKKNNHTDEQIKKSISEIEKDLKTERSNLRDFIWDTNYELNELKKKPLDIHSGVQPDLYSFKLDVVLKPNYLKIFETLAAENNLDVISYFNQLLDFLEVDFKRLEKDRENEIWRVEKIETLESLLRYGDGWLNEIPFFKKGSVGKAFHFTYFYDNVSGLEQIYNENEKKFVDTLAVKINILDYCGKYSEWNPWPTQDQGTFKKFKKLFNDLLVITPYAIGFYFEDYPGPSNEFDLYARIGQSFNIKEGLSHFDFPEFVGFFLDLPRDYEIKKFPPRLEKSLCESCKYLPVSYSPSDPTIFCHDFATHEIDPDLSKKYGGEIYEGTREWQNFEMPCFYVSFKLKKFESSGGRGYNNFGWNNRHHPRYYRIEDDPHDFFQKLYGK